MPLNWTGLIRCGCKNHPSFKLTSKLSYRFAQFTFNSKNETLIAIDTEGQAYLINFIQSNVYYKNIGYAGLCTFIEFNPLNNEDILIGLNTNDIKIAKVANVSCFCILSGHKSPPKRASFYKEFVMTASVNQVIIWCLKTYSKVHHLKLLSSDLSIKTAVFSNAGLITILYKSNIIQCWVFKQFEQSTKINLNDYKLHNVKDINFSKNGKMLIIGGNQQIIIFDTQNWNIIKKVNFNQHSSIINKVIMIEKPFNTILLTLLNDGSLEFYDLSLSKLVKHCQCRLLKMTKKIIVSPNSQYLAQIKTDGELIISDLNEILMKKITIKKNKESKEYVHCADDHLYYVKNAIKNELKLDRLLPILKEFGEYPERHRALIWSTIMNLPTNKDAYISLTKSVLESDINFSSNNYPLANKIRAALLATTVKCLSKWCPILRHSDFISDLVFPFIVVFQKTPILAFESSLMIILNFCQKWFEYHPLPPLNVLGMIENILLEIDPNLLSFFYNRKITSTDYAWPLLRTTLSEVLSASEWLILWDHLFSYGKPSLLLSCTIAFNVCCREVIISSMKTSEDIQRFYSSQSHIQAKKLIKLAQNIDKLMPSKIHPNQYIRDTIITLPVSEIYAPLPQVEYPKILTEDFQLEFRRKCKQQKILEQEQNHIAKELEEIGRLDLEAKLFKEKIHKMRMKELYKCYENLTLENSNSDKNSYIVKWDTHDTIDIPIPTENSEQFSPLRNVSINDEETNDKNDEFQDVMEKQIQLLEEEVCNLLTKNHRSKSNKF